MERLTNDREVSEMNMCELAYNSCYAKDGKARIRDFDEDFDARELTIKLLEKYADIPNEFACDEDFDDFIMDALQYGTDDVLGLIAVFYRNVWAMADLRERLREYEDLEEQGKLMKLNCAVGDTVYEVQGLRGRIQPYTIISVHVSKCGNLYGWELKDGKGIYGNLNGFSEYALGKSVFLTLKEAEAKLAEMEEGKV